MADDPDKKQFLPPSRSRETGANAGSAESRQTIDNAQALVGGFINAQRQNAALSPAGYHRTTFSHPDIDVTYTNYNGAETIDYNAHPKEAAIADAILEQEAEGAPDLEPATFPPIVQPDQAMPGATGCLMVFFSTKGIAAFDMKDLDNGSVGTPAYLGTSKGSSWGSGVMPVGQYRLGDVGWILTPTDLVGGTRSNKMRLSTTKITDQVDTQATTGAVPIMNGTSPVYTVGGSFALVTDPRTMEKKVTQMTGMQMDGSVRVQPTGIDVDGTSYFFPEMIGIDIIVQMDAGSTYSGYGHSSVFDAALASKVMGLQKSIPNPLVTSVSLLDTKTVYYPTQGNQQIESIDATGECTVVTYGTFKHLAWQNGSSYYGKGAFGQIPTPQNVKLSQSARTYEVYDLASNQTTLKTTPAGLDDYSNTFPLQVYVYDKSKSNDTLAVGFPTISAICDCTQGLTLLDNKDAYSLIGSNFGGASGFTYTGSGSTISNEQVSIGFSDNYGVTYPPYTGSTADDAKNFYQTCKSVALGAPNFTGSNTIEMTEFLQSNDPPGSIMAQWMTRDDAPWPDDTISGMTGEGGTITGASSYNHPFAHGHLEQDLHRHTIVMAFGRTLAFDYVKKGDTGSTVTTTTKPPSMNIHAFPPAFDMGGLAKPFYNSIELNSSEQLFCTCFTPYDSYVQSPGGVTEPFKYWMHASNGKHVIQGYLINAVPHAFLDGAATPSFLQSVADGCSCAIADIKAMFMDISLDTVKGVADVQAAVYSTTPSGEPPAIANPE